MNALPSNAQVSVRIGSAIDIAATVAAPYLLALEKLRSRPPFESRHPSAIRWMDELESRLSEDALEDCASRQRVLPQGTTIVVGDLHGDIGVLFAVLCWRDAQFPDAEIVVLGDLIDRGPASASVASLAIRWWLSSARHVTLLGGNHDLAVECDPQSDQVISRIEPSEFRDWANGSEDRVLAQRLAHAFVRAMSKVPKWLVLPCGLLAVHGGVPHSDVLSGLERLADLESLPLAAHDLSWIRIDPDAERKTPNRRSSSCEMGLDDVRNGLQKIESLVQLSGQGISLSGLIRGHDHVAQRHQVCWTSDGRAVITINSMSFPTPEDAFESQTPTPMIAVIAGQAASHRMPVVTLHPLLLPPLRHRQSESVK